MALTITEAQAVNDLLRWVANATDAPSEARAQTAANLLAAKAYMALGAGLTETEVETVIWPRLSDRLVACDSDGAAQAVCRAIQSHLAHGGSIPWPSIAKPWGEWCDVRRRPADEEVDG